MKLIVICTLALVFGFICFGNSGVVEAKSYIRSYNRGGNTVKSHVRYKADGYKFNNYRYRPDRGYGR